MQVKSLFFIKHVLCNNVIYKLGWSKLKEKDTNNQTKLPTSGRLCSALFVISSDMLSILDLDGKILDCNKQFEHNTRYTKRELMGLGLIDLIVDDDINNALSVFEEIKNADIKHNVSLRMKRKDNSIFLSNWSGTTLKNELDEIEGYLVTGKDISNIEKLKNRLNESKKENIQEKMALVGEFSSRLTHDLRNPLSIIQISLENLKQMYDLDETKQKQFDKIERAIFRMTHQLTDVLDFINEKPLKFERIKFSHIISETLDSLQIPHDIKFILPKNDLKILCDKIQFAVVMNNLILNAIQSIGGKGLIAIGLEEKHDKIIIEIEDSGNGISEKDLPHVFEPMYTTKQSGTGLGLVSVKSIVESHRGTISVTSPPTKFKITLPK